MTSRWKSLKHIYIKKTECFLILLMSRSCFFVYTFNRPYSLQSHDRCESEAVFSMASVYKAHISLLLYYKAYYFPQLMLSGVFSVLIYFYFFKDIL